jgi:hypothetical protein
MASTGTWRLESNTIESAGGELRRPVAPLRTDMPADASAGMSAGSSGEPAKLAFAARLIPMTATEQQTAPAAMLLPRTGSDVPERSTADGHAPLLVLESNDKGSAVPITPSQGMANHGGDSQSTAEQDSNGGLPNRSRKNDEPQAIADELSQTATGRVIPHTGYAPEPRVDTPSQTTASSTAESMHPKEAPALAPGTEAPKEPGAARDIKLEIGGGDHRVEVRLMERGGEVLVAVKTSDSHLASTLREDLPALSSRLADSGFRADTWHPGASGAGEWHRQAERSAGGAPQDPDNQQGKKDDQQSGGRHSGERQAQQQKVPEEQLNQKQKGKDFEWFMSTLR